MTDQYNKQPNAQKWTAEVVKAHLDQIERDADVGPSFFLNRSLARLGLYKQIWSYWQRTFQHDDDIMEQMLLIETIFESKILEAAMKKEIAGPVAALTLKFNYNWNHRNYNTVPAINKNYQG